MSDDGELTGANDAVALAEALAVEAVERARDIMRKPTRGCGFQLQAAKLVLDIAGAGAAAADQRHTELLAWLKGNLSEGAYEEVVGALAKLQGQRGGSGPAAGEDEPQLQ